MYVVHPFTPEGVFDSCSWIKILIRICKVQRTFYLSEVWIRASWDENIFELAFSISTKTLKVLLSNVNRLKWYRLSIELSVKQILFYHFKGASSRGVWNDFQRFNKRRTDQFVYSKIRKNVFDESTILLIFVELLMQFSTFPRTCETVSLIL